MIMRYNQALLISIKSIIFHLLYLNKINKFYQFMRNTPSKSTPKIKNKSLTISRFQNPSYIPLIDQPSGQKQNNINTKVNPYKKNFQRTIDNTQSKSVIFNLANQIYQKHPRRNSQSAKRISQFSNPQKQGYSNSSVMKNLMVKTLQVPEYIKQLNVLNKQKKMLLQRIDNLKKGIAAQTKQKKELTLASKKHMNDLDYTNLNIKKLQNDIGQLEFNSKITIDEIEELKRILNNLNLNNERTIQNIHNEQKQIDEVTNFVKLTKHDMMISDKKLTDLKYNLTIALKTMNNNSVYIKYLESEKAEMLLYINNQFEYNKIKN